MNEINAIQLKAQYVNWLAEEISFKKVNSYLEITSPFLDINNDYLQVYVNITNSNQIHLTDDGYTIDNLNMMGIDINSTKRNNILNDFLKKYGVKKINNQLVVDASSKDFPQKLMLLMQAMININDMFMLSQSKVASLFNEDVKSFFINNDIYYSEDVSFIGKSGLCFSYDYLLQRTKNKPERLCKAINNPNLQNFKNNAFMWDDTKANRSPDSQFIVLLNDSMPVSSSVIEAYNNYDIKTILWSEKEKQMELLKAS